MNNPGQTISVNPKLKVFYIVFTFLYFTIIPLKIAAMSIHDWYKQGKDETKWEGSLFEIYESGGYFNETSYAWLSNHYCDLTSSYNSEACTTFTNLYGGGVAFIVFSCLEIIFSIVFVVFGIASMCQRNNCYLCLRLVFSVLIPLVGLLSFAIMAGTAVVTYTNACESTSNYLSSQSSTCALTGPQFELFNFLYAVVISISFWISLCVIKCEDIKAAEVNNNQTIENQNIHQDQDALTNRTFPVAIIEPPQTEDGVAVGVPYKDV